MKTSLLLVAVLCTATTYAQITENFDQNPCFSKTTCHECLQSPTCAWCLDPNFGDKIRCFQPAPSSSEYCLEEYTWNPYNEFRVLKSLELSKAHSVSDDGNINSGSNSSSSQSSSASEKVVIAPQHVQIKLRTNEPFKFKMYYTQAEDYPLDLYYLMDLSKSMEDDKEKLARLGHLLGESMRNITSDFRLGFGSFVDKPVFPYVSTVPKNLNEPCLNCQAPYSFRNVMSLSRNTSEFSHMVQNAALSGNLDAPDGALDAIMQALVCRQEIGWRENARRVLVVSTDSGFHSAGDGKLGGIISPNDGNCHLDPNTGYYTHASIQDYPSVSQINLKVMENEINIIFAVTQEKIDIYRQLQNHIVGSFSAQLSADSSNIVDLIENLYQQISSSVEIKDTASNGIKVNYYSSCLNKYGEPKQTNKCRNIKVGDVIEFDVEIEMTACPADPKDWRQTMQIYPVGINESLTVEIDLLCSCSCENPGHPDYIENAEQCSGNGISKCGICECKPGFFGRRCECTDDGGIDHTQNCRPNNATVECSGRGNCVCGQCNCLARNNIDEVISGKFCECDNFSCDRHNGKLCSDNGVCVCGECLCNSGWTGSECSCRASNDTCLNPNLEDAEICSGHGECVCGRCECLKTEDLWYSGKYCDNCVTCGGRCSEFKECVQCLMYKTGQYSEEECPLHCPISPIAVSSVEADVEKDESLCSYYDENDCRFEFAYSFTDDDKLVIKAENVKKCPPKVG